MGTVFILHKQVQLAPVRLVDLKVEARYSGSLKATILVVKAQA